MESHVYCTLFDSGYLSRGLTLFSSLRENGDESPIYVLALDDKVVDFLKKQQLFSNIIGFSLSDLEQKYPELLEVKSSRTRMEYVFTCTPYLIEYSANLAGLRNQLCIYVDSDLYYFSDPNVIVSHLETSSVGLTPHRYPKNLESKLLKYGKYNAGWVAFRNDVSGNKALGWYKSRTLEWCSDKPHDGKYADQGYLDEISKMAGATILGSPGINLAPWNTSNYTFTKSSDGSILIDNQPFIFFHFHGLRKIGKFYSTSQLIYRSPLSRFMKERIYLPYVERLISYDKLLSSDYTLQTEVRKRGNGLHGMLSRVWKRTIDLISVLTGNAIDTSRI